MNPFVFIFIMAISLGYLVLFGYNQLHYVFVTPTFTASAYQPNGFYHYYAHHDCCLTVHVKDASFDSNTNIATSWNARLILTMMGVPTVTDQQLTDGYTTNRTIIVLHNEYVSQTEFDYLNSSKVIYLYPNAMYGMAEYHCALDDCIATNEPEITLIGDVNHTSNYFNWKYDNTQYEITEGKYVQCNGVNHWNTLSNGSLQLECFALNPIETLQSILQVMI